MNTKNGNPPNKRTKLSGKQIAALPHLASSNSIIKGAISAGLSRSTAYRWMKDPEFRRQVEHIREEAADLAKSEIKGLMLKAVTVINETLHSDDPQAQAPRRFLGRRVRSQVQVRRRAAGAHRSAQ